MDPYSFLGSGIKFPLQIDSKTGHLAMSHYEEDIREAIGIIMHTYMGERVMRENFGARVADFLFSSGNLANLDMLAKELEDLIAAQEPRIEDVEVTRIPADTENMERVEFRVSYLVRSTNRRDNHVYPFYMDEGNKEERII